MVEKLKGSGLFNSSTFHLFYFSNISQTRPFAVPEVSTRSPATSQAFVGDAAPSGAGAYIAPGEKVGWSGTAKGRVWLFIER